MKFPGRGLELTVALRLVGTYLGWMSGLLFGIDRDPAILASVLLEQSPFIGAFERIGA